MKKYRTFNKKKNTSKLKPNIWFKKAAKTQWKSEFVKWETYLEKYLECRKERQTENMKEKMSRLNDLRNIYLEFQKKMIE